MTAVARAFVVRASKVAVANSSGRIVGSGDKSQGLLALSTLPIAFPLAAYRMRQRGIGDNQILR
jgi:hypothetical protein